MNVVEQIEGHIERHSRQIDVITVIYAAVADLADLLGQI